MISPNNKTAPRVLEYVTRNPNCTAAEITLALYCSTRKVQKNLEILLSLKLVYVSTYFKCPGAGKAARAYTVGSRKSVELKSPNVVKRHAVKLEWQRGDRARRRVLERSKLYGPFGIVAAQLEQK